MNKKGLTFIHVMIVLLVLCGGVFFFYANQPAPEGGMGAEQLAALQSRFMQRLNKDDKTAFEDMTEEEFDAYLAKQQEETDKLLEDLKKQTEALQQQTKEFTEKAQAAAKPAPAASKSAPSKPAAKKHQGVKVLGKDDLTAEELAALGQATGKSAQELKKMAASRRAAAAVKDTYKTDLTDNSLAEMEAFTGPKMLIFYADWCPHCRNMKPVFAQLAKEYAGQVMIFAFNVDKAPRAYSKYSPRGVPSMVFFKKNHQKYTQAQGEQPASALRAHLDAIK